MHTESSPSPFLYFGYGKSKTVIAGPKLDYHCFQESQIKSWNLRGKKSRKIELEENMLEVGLLEEKKRNLFWCLCSKSLLPFLCANSVIVWTLALRIK